MLLKKKIAIHATNIFGLGASEVSASLIQSLNSNYDNVISRIHLPCDGPLKSFMVDNPKTDHFRRYLNKSISRFFECVFSNYYFSNNYNYIVLGDIPLYGIYNQVLLVHQANLVSPIINPNSSNSLTFQLTRFLFKRNLRFVKTIIVQTDIIKKELLATYPQLRNRIKVVSQPVPANFKYKTSQTSNSKKDFKKITFFYPSSGYPHKNHKFLFKLKRELGTKKVDFKIFVTLNREEFKKYQELEFVENLGVIPFEEMSKYYSKFNALLFLSKIESYGLPLVEAMVQSIPIVTIRQGYSEWMCGSKALYFEDNNVSSFLNAIRALREQNIWEVDYTQELIKFPKSWDVVADKFIEEII